MLLPAVWMHFGPLGRRSGEAWGGPGRTSPNEGGGKSLRKKILKFLPNASPCSMVLILPLGRESWEAVGGLGGPGRTSPNEGGGKSLRKKILKFLPNASPCSMVLILPLGRESWEAVGGLGGPGRPGQALGI